MSRKHSTAKTLKTTGRAAKAVGKGTARTTRFTIAHWRGLLPFLCIGAAGTYAVAAQLFAWAYGPSAWIWSILVGLVLFVWADGWVGSLPRRLRPQAIAFVLFTIVSAVLFILASNVVEVYFSIAVTALVLGTWWWNGSAYQGHKATERFRRKMESVLHKLGLTDDTGVTGVNVTAKGDVEWRLHLGDNDRLAQLGREDIAHLLKVDLSRVMVRRIDKGTTRNVKVVLLAASPNKAKSVTHPAATAAGRAEGTDWAPGTRTVEQGAPIGPAMAEPDKVSVFHVFRRGYGALHNLIAGQTGSGKSVTLKSIVAHVDASIDAVAAGVDLVKGGETFMPFHENGGMAHLLYLPAQHAADPKALLQAAQALLDELGWLRIEVATRTGLMAEGKVLDEEGERTTVWPASPEHPVIVYFFEEYASTISAIEKLDADLAEDIVEAVNDIGRTARSSGISINIVTQRPTVEEIPMALRGQLNQTILHKLNTANDRGKLWSEYDVDPVGVLGAGMGLCYVDASGGVDPVLTKAYDLSKPRVCAEIAKAYEATQPTIAWNGTEPVAAAPQVEAEPAEADRSALTLLRDAAAEEETIPAGVGIIGGAAEPEPGDDERLAAILTALQAAEDGLTRSQIERVIGTGGDAAASKATALRLLRVLQDAEKVLREGQGKASRYRINTAALAAA